MPDVDHLVYATTDVAATVRALGVRLGVTAAPGGHHPRWGTHNALLALGERLYLEIVGPDPGHPDPTGPRPFGLEDLTSPRLVTWAVRAADLERIAAAAARVGVDLGVVASASRRTPDARLLSWRMTDPMAERANGIVPFFIDWGDTPHPAEGAPAGCVLSDLRARHPEADWVRGVLAELGLTMPIESGDEPALLASVRTPRGTIERL